MFNIFNPPFNSARTPIVLPVFDYLNRQTKREIEKVVEHYQSNVYQSTVSQRLFKILTELKPYLHLSPETLFNQLRDSGVAYRFYANHNIVSPISNGSIMTGGELYNRNIAEIWIGVEYPVAVNDLLKNVDSLKPLRVVSHDFSDFSYGLIDGRYNCQEKGLAIISIDLAVLAIQYQHWYNNLRYVKSRNYHLPTQHYIARYIWTGALYSHMDNVIFNRLSNMIIGKPNHPTTTNAQSFYLTDYSSRYDTEFVQLTNQWRKSPSDWGTRLNSIPSVSHGTYWSAIAMPDVAPTRQVKWALMLSKLRALELMLHVDRYPQNTQLNRSDRMDLERDLRLLRNDKSYEMFLPDQLIKRIEWVYNEVNQQP